MSFIVDTLSVCLGLTFLVLVHSLGHFLAARLTGVPVTLFSVGFGHPLIKLRFKNSWFQLCRFPFGGYITYGDDANDKKRFRDWKKRIIVYLAGPLTSMVLTFLMITVFFIHGYEVEKSEDDEPRIGYIEEGSPAAIAGLRAGDIIYEVNGTPVKRWGQLSFLLEESHGKELNLVYERDSLEKTVTIEAPGVPYGNEGDIGIRYEHKAEISAMTRNSPAAKAGFKTGDIILEIEDQPVTFYEVSKRIGSVVGQQLMVVIRRGDETILLKVTPEMEYYLESEAMRSSLDAARKRSLLRRKLRDLDFYLIRKEGAAHVVSERIANREEAKAILKRTDLPVALTMGTRGVIGVGFREYKPKEYYRPGILKSIDVGFFGTMNLIRLNYEALKKVFTGGIVPKVSFGPSSVKSEKDRDSLFKFFLIYATISMQLALINLLPIPSTDAGSLLIRLVEIRLRKIISQKLKKSLNIGGILFIAFMILYSVIQLGKIAG